MESEKTTRKRTILIVDSFEAVLEIASDYLQRQGYLVLTASNTQDALHIGATYEGTIDLVLTEEQMPGISGIVLAEQLRFMRPTVAVVVMSTTLKGKTYQKYEAELGAKFLWKPFTNDELLEVVRTMTEPGNVAGFKPEPKPTSSVSDKAGSC